MSVRSHEIKIDGVGWRVVQEEFARQFLDVVRQQGGTQDEPAESSLNPADLWRRAQTDMTHGAGQEWFDDPDSDRFRFESSDDLDVSAVRSVKLSKRLDRVDVNSTPYEYVKAVTTADEIYVLTGGTTMEVFSSTQATSDAAPENIVDATSDGETLYAAVSDGAGTGGVYTYSGTTLGSEINQIVPDKIAFVRGRLIVAVGNELFNVTDLSSTTAPSAFATPIYPDFVWDAFGETGSAILAAGHTGDQSFVYRITIQEDGTGLTPPLVAAQLPDGETVRAIVSYVGQVVIATSRGIRLAELQGDSLVYGRLIHEVSDVYDLEPSGDFVYYGSNGALWSLDLSRFVTVNNQPVAPAYSHRISTGSITDIVSVFPKPPNVSAFTGADFQIMLCQSTGVDSSVGGLMIWSGSVYVTSGELLTSKITYGMADEKNFLFLDVVSETEGTNDTIFVTIVDQDGVESVSGFVSPEKPITTFFVNRIAEWLQIRFQLRSGDTVNGLTSPHLVRWTLRSLPIPKRTEQVIVPIDLRRQQTTLLGGHRIVDVEAAYHYFHELVRTGRTIVFEDFVGEHIAVVENLQRGPNLDVSSRADAWEGVVTLVIRLYEPNIFELQADDLSPPSGTLGTGTFGSGVLGDTERPAP